MAFTPFMQGSEAQGIISNYLGGGYAASPNVNTAGQFRNPIFDIRTQQELAGDLDPSALYPNPQIDFSVDETVDPCPEGFMLVDGVCQPIEQFGQSYGEQRDDDDREEEEQEYHSIEEMREMGDYELLSYLNDGWLKGDPYKKTIGGKFMPSWFSIPFGKQNEMRRNFIIQELKKRGYGMTTDDKGESTFNVGNALGIISNAEAANLGGNRLATNQPSIFTPEEINYQIQAKNEADQVIQQGGNPYAKTMTRDEIIRDAQQSGGTINPFEVQGINQPQQQQPQYTGVNPFKDEGVWI
jgi:hypothetical protein